MGEDGRPDAHLVVLAGSGAAREVAIYERMFVGRECTGVDERHRLLVDDASASRNHLEIRVRRERGASVVDTSTNGTRLNGVRIERAVPVPLESGDHLRVGTVELEFRTDWSRPADAPTPTETIRRVSDADLVMVVGDIVGFSTISAASPSRVVMETMETLLTAFRTLLTKYHGTLSNFVGDAFFAVWETESVPQAPQHALDFVVAAGARLDELAPTLLLRSPDGGPLRIGWGVARGDAAVSSMTGALLGVVGDAANLAFRLSGLAAREGRGEVLVAATLYDDIAGRYPLDTRAWVAVKGRPKQEPVHALRLPIGAPRGAT